MINIKTNKKLILPWLLSITAFIQMRPYFVWSTYGSGELELIIKVSLLTAAPLIIIYLLMKNRNINKDTIITVSLLILVQMYTLMIGIDNTSFLAIGNYFVLTVIVGFLLLEEHERKDVFDKFSLIFAISLISGIIIWTFINIGVHLPFKILQTDHIGKAARGDYYQKYLGSVLLYSPSSKFLRLNAMYDEPGVVGTFSALFLIADDFNFKGKVRNIIILVGGILSFSMAFYILIIVGIVIKIFNKGFIRFAIVLIVALGLFQGLMNMDTDNIFIKDVFQKRFRIINGSISGDNRTNKSFDYEYDDFLNGNTSRILFGYGYNASSNNPLMYGSATYKMLVYDYGIIGFIILLGWIIYATRKMAGFDRRSIMLLVVFMISIYQRPFVYTIPYMFLLFGGYANLNEKLYN